MAYSVDADDYVVVRESQDRRCEAKRAASVKCVLKDQAGDVFDTIAQECQGSFDWIVVEPRGWLQRWRR